MATIPITLYSIGHSNVAAERLIALLEQHSIRTLCDVRSAPYSRYNPQFNREALAATLQPTGIAYRYMGDALGGKPADGSRPDYAQIATSPHFQRALGQLIDLGQRAPTAFMCGEADYHGCHRHRLIAPALIECGVHVWHIMSDGSCERGEIEPQQMRMF
ncbi:MAG: DUF488 domain-containing protein [Roseiflexaceae bacterium]